MLFLNFSKQFSNNMKKNNYKIFNLSANSTTVLLGSSVSFSSLGMDDVQNIIDFINIDLKKKSILKIDFLYKKIDKSINQIKKLLISRVILLLNFFHIFCYFIVSY